MADQLSNDHLIDDGALISKREVCALLGNISASTLYRGIAEGIYPAAIPISERISRWSASEVKAARAARARSRGAGFPITTPSVDEVHIGRVRAHLAAVVDSLTAVIHELDASARIDTRSVGG